MFYSTESELENNLPAINSFYINTLKKAYLTTPAGALFYAFAIPEHAHTAVVISAGRIEGLDKYKELLWELYANNVAVFIVDHQGQGRSYRLLKNSHKGYVKQFADYSRDLNQFNLEVVNPHWQGKKVLLSHSMGGAIAFDYLARYKHNFNGAFLSAPMFDIYTKGIPKPIAQFIAASASFFGFSGCYALGQSDYSPEEFALNTLTSSQIRYTHFRDTYQQTPLLQLGGVTYGWLNASFKFIKALDKLSITTPLFIASAEKDQVVDNTAQDKMASRHKNTLIKRFEGAKHELFFERDEIRQPLLTSLYKFCESLTIKR